MRVVVLVGAGVLAMAWAMLVGFVAGAPPLVGAAVVFGAVGLFAAWAR